MKQASGGTWEALYYLDCDHQLTGRERGYGANASQQGSRKLKPRSHRPRDC